MLLLAAQCYNEQVVVATVDHGLRPEAGGECALVASQCERLGVACTILRVEVADGNLQEQARVARYAALGQWAEQVGATSIATAHHADDQAETLLMRLNRGSGTGGLSGIRERTMIEGCPVPIIRPLLHFRRSELADIVKAADVQCADDPSNRDDSYERVRVRQWLAGNTWLDPRAVAQSAAHIAQAEATLEGIADDVWAREVCPGEHGEIAVPYTDWLEVNIRLVSRAIARLGGDASRGDIAALLTETIREPISRANLAGVLVERREQSYVCRPEPARRS